MMACLTLANEIVFKQQQQQDTNADQINQQIDVRSIDRSINNLQLVDQYYKENLKQTQMLFECNSKLTILEYELNRMTNGKKSMFKFGSFESSQANSHLIKSNIQLSVGENLPDATNGVPETNSNSNNQSNSMNLFIKNLKIQLIDYFK